MTKPNWYSRLPFLAVLAMALVLTGCDDITGRVSLQVPDVIQLVGLAFDIAGVVLVGFYSVHSARQGQNLTLKEGSAMLETTGWVLIVIGFALQGLSVVVGTAS